MRHILPVAVVGLALALVLPVTARSEPAVEAGILNCSVYGGAGFVIGSSKRLECVFQSGSRRENYDGRINKFGLDLGVTSNGVFAWAVLAPARDHLEPGVLQGNYAGVSGEATVGIGVGANALVGGSNRSITLQPLSVGAQQGLNLAVGIAALHLKLAE